MSTSCAQHTVKYVTKYRLEYDCWFMFLKNHSGSIVEDGIQKGETKAGEQARKHCSIQGKMLT